MKGDFSLKNISKLFPEARPTIQDVLETEVADKYILTENLWKYLYNYAKKHQPKVTVLGLVW
nr:hypothetical protein [Acinetobacter lwoffii]